MSKNKQNKNANESVESVETVENVKTKEVSETPTTEPINESVENVNGKDFVNPFAQGVSYKDFKKALGKKSVGEYLEGKEKTPGVSFTDVDVEWLEQELQAHANN